MKRMKLKLGVVTTLFWLAHAGIASAQEGLVTSALGFAGPGVPTPLTDLVRFKNLDLVSQYMVGGAINQRMIQFQDALALEAEAQVLMFPESTKLWALNAAVVVRFLRTPWSNALGATFGFGNGLSWATQVPKMESDYISKTSRTLYHLLFEFDLPLGKQSDWSLVARLQHRSGAFGLFDGVVGGSDFLCLGLKKQL